MNSNASPDIELAQKLDRLRSIHHKSWLAARTLAHVAREAQQLQIPAAHLCSVKTHPLNTAHAVVSITRRDDTIKGQTVRHTTPHALPPKNLTQADLFGPRPQSLS